MTEETGTTLRDTLESAVEAVETETPIEQVVEAKAERARDEAGKFAKAEEAANIVAKPAEVQAPRKAPSSWKKDYWESYEKLDPKLQEYIEQREGEFAKGVSTYKQEWDRAKPLMDALAPFESDLKQHGIAPATWIQTMAMAHKALATGSPQEKLQMFSKLSQDYGIPLQALYDRNVQQQYLSQPTHQAQQAPDVDAIVEQKLMQHYSNQEVASFQANADKYPHFTEVRETMAGLLQAGLAADLPSAYEAAVRMPAHSSIFTAMQEQQSQQAAEKVKADKLAAAQKARANAVSPKSATPIGTSTSGKKGLRAQLEEQFDGIAGGRV